jgi:signal transduction histidine kinase
MRLLTKITSLYLLITLMVFAVGGVMAYYVIKEEIDAEHRRFLRRRLDRTAELIGQGEKIESYDGAKLDVVHLGERAHEYPIHFSDTLVWHPYLERMEINYKANTVQKINGQYYYMETFDVIVEADDITETVVRSLSRIFLLLLVAVGLIGALFSARIFKPFNETLNRIRDFRVRSNEPLGLPNTNTREFRRLNYFVEQMASRSRREYQALKEFSENASHEMQTPLAIARGKLELMMDSPHLKDKDLELLLSAQKSLQKLSKLGRSLSLLTKIENEEFRRETISDFSAIAKHVVHQFEELIPLKSLSLKQQIAEGVALRIDPVLADVLVTNLIQNAVRHNVEGGCIDVLLDEERLLIRNTGTPPSIAPEVLFQRFRKDRQSGESLGLGLAIVRRICELNNLDIRYRYIDQLHAVEIRFSG